MSRISIEPHPTASADDKALIRIRDVSEQPLALKFKLEWVGRKQTLGPYGWQGSDHFIRPRESRLADGDLILEIGADVLGAIPADTPIEIEIPNLRLTEELQWPDLGAPVEVAEPVAPVDPPAAPPESTGQMDARTFSDPPAPRAEAAAPRPAPAPAKPSHSGGGSGRGGLMLVLGLVGGVAIGLAGYHFLAPQVLAPQTGDDGGSGLEAQMNRAQADLATANQRISELEEQAARDQADLAQLRAAAASAAAPSQPDPDQADSGREAAEQLAEQRQQRIVELERERDGLRAQIAALEAVAREAATSTAAPDGAAIDRALAEVRQLYSIDPAIMAEIKKQLLAGGQVGDITRALSGQLDPTARQSLFNTLCDGLPAQCTR